MNVAQLKESIERIQAATARAGRVWYQIRLDPAAAIRVPWAAVSLSAIMFAIVELAPEIWPVGLFAALPILAVAPEIATPTAAGLAFLAALLGHAIAWPMESGLIPLPALAVAHMAGAAIFATVVAAHAEAARRWSGLIASLVYPTVTAAFFFAMGRNSPFGSFGNPAYGVVGFRFLFDSASVFGLPPVVFAVCFLSSGIAIWLYRSHWLLDRPETAPTAAAAFFAIILLCGVIDGRPAGSPQSVRVGIVAGDDLSSAADSGDPVQAANAMSMYTRPVFDAAGKGAQIVLLPEKLVGVTPKDELEISAGFARLAVTAKVWLVVGMNRVGQKPKRNIAIVYSPEGKIAAAYAERYPTFIAEQGYVPGHRNGAFDAPWGRSAVAIGNDLSFAGYLSELSNDGVRVVFVPQSDWGGRRIHRTIAISRAVEAGVSIARGGHDGILETIDFRGRVTSHIDSGEHLPEILVSDLAIGLGPTVYARTGDWFGRLAIFVAIVLMMRLGISLWYPRLKRARLARIVLPSGVISVPLVSKGADAQVNGSRSPQNGTIEESIYRPPPRPT
jgi:apolipoprotein N-acyltransferase